MAALSLFLLALSLLIAFSYKPFQANASESLIQSLCSRTPEPVICADCINRDPASKTEDAKGLALISIHCAEFDSGLLFNYTYDLYYNTTDSALRQVLDSCWWRFQAAHDNLFGAVRSTEEGGYGVAGEAIARDVLPLIDFCMDLFEKHPEVVLPEKILAGMIVVTQDCQISLGILSDIERKQSK